MSEREILELVEEAATGEDTIRAPIHLSREELELLQSTLKMRAAKAHASYQTPIRNLLDRLDGVGMMLGGMQGLRDDVKSGKIKLDDYK